MQNKIQYTVTYCETWRTQVRQIFGYIAQHNNLQQAKMKKLTETDPKIETSLGSLAHLTCWLISTLGCLSNSSTTSERVIPGTLNDNWPGWNYSQKRPNEGGH